MGKIVANLAKGKIISTKENALSATFSVDLTEVMSIIQGAVKDALIKRFKVEDDQHPMTVKVLESDVLHIKPNCKPENNNISMGRKWCRYTIFAIGDCRVVKHFERAFSGA